MGRRGRRFDREPNRRKLLLDPVDFASSRCWSSDAIVPAMAFARTSARTKSNSKTVSLKLRKLVREVGVRCGNRGTFVGGIRHKTLPFCGPVQLSAAKGRSNADSQTAWAGRCIVQPPGEILPTPRSRTMSRTH